MPAIMSRRTTSSAFGFESRTSSSVSTMIPAILLTPSETELNASLVTGFGFCSPTHPYVPPAVCAGTLVLNGTLRSPGILPRMVAGRSSSRKSVAMFWFTSGSAQVASVVVPGATAALRYSETSGVESFHRLAYSAASYMFPLQTNFAQAMRTNAVPLGTFALTCTTAGRGVDGRGRHRGRLADVERFEIAHAGEVGVDGLDARFLLVVGRRLAGVERDAGLGGLRHQVGHRRQRRGAAVLQGRDLFAVRLHGAALQGGCFDRRNRRLRVHGNRDGREFGPQPALDVPAAGLERRGLERLEPNRQAAHQSRFDALPGFIEPVAQDAGIVDAARTGL